MLSAKEAKELAKSSDQGLSEFLEDINDLIEEVAKDGELEVTYILDENMEPFLKDVILMNLTNEGYAVKLVQVKQTSGDEYGDNVQSWMEDGIYINWRMA